MPSGRQRLLSRMARVIADRPDSAAVLEPDGATVTYREFDQLVGRLAAGLVPLDPARPVGLLVDRGALAYAAMWACISLGRPYVPLNPSYPRSRLSEIVEQARIVTLVAGGSQLDSAAGLGFGPEAIVTADEPTDRVGPDPWTRQVDVADHRWAYVLFTSGSTGKPKGVPISYANLAAFTENMAATIPLQADDVCTQVCELSFDFSVHEIFMALLAGATLCPARSIDLFNPAGYVERNAITVWISVPSLARVALGGPRAAEPGPIDALASVRLSIFNGEALTVELAESWSEAAPNTEVWNNYGPTECTVAVTAQLWSGEAELAEAGIVAIGSPFGDCRTAIALEGPSSTTPAIVETATTETADRADVDLVGELLLDGRQRFAGYLDHRVGECAFVDHQAQRWYRSGDRVAWRHGRLYHLGRLDHQVKVGGHRIELAEVEHRLRRSLGLDELAVLAHPRSRPSELVLFVAQPLADRPTAETSGLARYMVPKRVVTVDAMPRSAHGKLDRGALHRMLEGS